MPSVRDEADRLLALFDVIETIREVAESMQDGDQRRERLTRVQSHLLAVVDPVRPGAAGVVLGLSAGTVRFWTREGVLTTANAAGADARSRPRLDPVRLHTVWRLVREIRTAAASSPSVIDAVYRRLADEALLAHPDVQIGLDQMRRGEGRVLIPRPQESQ